MFGLGVGELIVIFLIVFLLFGPKALPEIAKGLGQALKAFKKETKEVSEQLKTNFDVESSDVQKQEVVDSKWDDSNDFHPDSNRKDWRKDIKADDQDKKSP